MKHSSFVLTGLVALLILSGAVFSGQSDRIQNYNFSDATQPQRSAVSAAPPVGLTVAPVSRPMSVGSATGVDNGIGVGMSVALTYDDAQNWIGWGRHIAHWWNQEYGSSAEVSVHFGYRIDPNEERYGPGRTSGYNVYDAAADPGLEWPLLLDAGCTLQSSDTAGYGTMPALAVMSNGRVVMSALSHYGNGFLAGDVPYIDNMVFYQGGEFECDYTYGVDATMVDSLTYRPYFMDQSDGNYTRDPIIETQWDGSNNIVHLLLTEVAPTELQGNDYVDNREYHTAVYFRKVGTGAQDGTWSSGQVIDSVWFPWMSMAAAPYPYEGVAITYTNPTYYGALLNNEDDVDVWCRESSDRGLNWGNAYDITNYTNAIAGDPNHFTAWLETQCLYSTDGDLHVIWTAKPTSADPYYDGYMWDDLFQNLYHWSKSTDVVSKVANGTYFSMHTFNPVCDFYIQACGFGGSNAGIIANINIAECNDKLYCVWNQMHERANHGDWCNNWQGPEPGWVDDCAYTGFRGAIANWEIMMSVSDLANTSLWDLPRNLSNTYTPGCGLPDDPEATGPCGNEYKPTVERYGFDETGLAVEWPSETVVDMTPASYAPYDGNFYLNMQYVDDQFPGPSDWGLTTDPRTLNSIKWLRLACVEPVYEPAIDVHPASLDWPNWVAIGQVTNFPVTVFNTGNMTLTISDIVPDDGGEGWLHVTPIGDNRVLDVSGTVTFDVIIDATAISEPTWLEGTVTIESDAINEPSWVIPINLLAAEHVEPVVWDTVASHENMFNIFFNPEGECVALAVSNHGEMGYSALGHGSVNLDYVESELECGVRSADGYYLRSGSAFVITADDVSGANAKVTSSYNLADQLPVYSWNPTEEKGSMQWGEHLGPNGAYDSAYTGQMVNRDTTIAIERTYYAPRSDDPANDTIDFVIALTKVYSADGAPHNHVTVGDVYDWNVPSDSAGRNNSFVSSNGVEFLYVRGVDTANTTSCQWNENRFAAAAFGGAWDASETEFDFCDISDQSDYYGCVALPQHLMEDTSHYRDGTDLVPDQPNPEVWWDETGVSGVNAADNELQNSDQGVWLTHKYDYNLGANDTLWYWVILTTVRNGNLEQLEKQVLHAANWFGNTLHGCEIGGGGCCIGHVGDANGSGDDMPTIGDISVIVDAKFIGQDCSVIPCLAEADYNQSGGCDPTCDDITIGDISALIDGMFISGCILVPMPENCLPECLPCTTPGWWQ